MRPSGYAKIIPLHEAWNLDTFYVIRISAFAGTEYPRWTMCYRSWGANARLLEPAEFEQSLFGGSLTNLLLATAPRYCQYQSTFTNCRWLLFLSRLMKASKKAGSPFTLLAQTEQP